MLEISCPTTYKNIYIYIYFYTGYYAGEGRGTNDLHALLSHGFACVVPSVMKEAAFLCKRPRWRDVDVRLRLLYVRRTSFGMVMEVGAHDKKYMHFFFFLSL